MGEILDFKRDTLRKRYSVPEHREHGAKLEVRTFMWLVEKYTKPGDIILDPMSGIGTVHIAATMGRHTIAVELSPRFVEIQRMNIEKLQEEHGLTADYWILPGDCRRWLPLQEAEINMNTPPAPADAIIFSPPYADVEKAGMTSGFTEKDGSHMNVGAFGYDDQQANVGNITVYPLYLDAMRHIYKVCNQSLEMGGPLIIVTKDKVKNNRRVYISKDNIRMALENGFDMEDWHRRDAGIAIRQIVPQRRRIEKGTDRPELLIQYEDLIVMRKVKDV
jgi:modification methylase